MQVICDATQSSIVEESVIALQILAKISSLYYQYLSPYMDQALVPVSFKVHPFLNFSIIQYLNLLVFFLRLR